MRNMFVTSFIKQLAWIIRENCTALAQHINFILITVMLNLKQSFSKKAIQARVIIFRIIQVKVFCQIFLCSDRFFLVQLWRIFFKCFLIIVYLSLKWCSNIPQALGCFLKFKVRQAVDKINRPAARFFIILFWIVCFV